MLSQIRSSRLQLYIIVSIFLSSTYSWNLIGKRIGRSVIAGSLLFNTLPAVSHAIIEGDAPKMEFFKAEESISTGPAVYDSSEALLVKAKVRQLAKLFDNMIMKCEQVLFLDAGKNPQRADAQGIISTYMGQLKSEMRTISKFICAGDIYQRQTNPGLSGTREAFFDYNTGQFALKPLAADAEAVISVINDIYFNVIPKSDVADIRKEIEIAKADFKEWFTMAQKQL